MNKSEAGKETGGNRSTGTGIHPLLILRSIFGGILMGLANLVPGISGGTMLLAAGIYPKFIEGVASVTRLRFRMESLVVLGCVGLAAVGAIVLFAGLLKDLVVEQRWVMYSLFIGLTLGGIPVVWKLVRSVSVSLVFSAVVSFSLMVLLAWLQATGYVGKGGTGFLMMFIAGLAGASAMILPGLSGGYLLLLLGVYLPILAAVDAFKEALKARDISALIEPTLSVVIPVGLGVVIGVGLVGNLLQWLFKNFKQATLGVLLGLLIGSVVGLWPFQEGVKPEVGDTVKARVMTAERIEELDEEDWPQEYFQPDAGQIAGAITLIVLGFAITISVAAFGGKEEQEPVEESSREEPAGDGQQT